MIALGIFICIWLTSRKSMRYATTARKRKTVNALANWLMKWSDDCADNQI